MPLVPEIITALPKIKATPRVDFRVSEFDQAIVTHGYRVLWERAAPCPCRNNPQTEQPDINCPLCQGDAFYYFLPDEAVRLGATEDSQGNSISLNEEKSAVEIYALITSLTQDIQVFEKFGEWMFGMSKISAQAENKLSYRDRLTMIDSEMVYAEKFESTGAKIVPITGHKNAAGVSYEYIKVNNLRSLTTEYHKESDYIVNDDNQIEWLIAPPLQGTLLSVHGLIRPRWIVMEHLHTIRDTNVTGGTNNVKDQKHEKLPVQVVAKLDFLVNT